MSAKELRRLRMSMEPGQPYEQEGWVERTAIALGLEHTIRPKGRPPKRSGPSVGSKS